MADTFGIIGNAQVTELPQTEVPEQDLVEEKKRAKFSKTKEWAELKDWMEQKIDHYSTYLPDGRPLTDVSAEERGNYWLAANIIISDYKEMISRYEDVKEAIKNSGK